MKNFIFLLSLLIFQNLAFGGGEGGSGTAGGNGGDGKRVKRAIASVPDDQSIKEDVDNFGKECLTTLGSSSKLNPQDKEYRSKLDVEIQQLIDSKKKGRSIASIDSIRYPECYAYANETNNEVIKSLLSKKKSSAVALPEHENSSGISK